MATKTIGFNIKIFGTTEQVTQTGKLEKALNNLNVQRKTLNKSVKEATSFLKTYNKDLKREKDLFDSGAISAREYTEVTDKLNKIAKSSRAILKGEATELGRIKVETDALRTKRSELAKQIKEENRINQLNTGSLRLMEAELKKATNEYKLLTDAKRENGKEGQILQKRINQLNDELKDQDSKLGINTRRVGSYKEAVRGLEKQLTELIVEQRKLKAAGKTNSTQFRSIQKEIDKTEKEYRQLNIQMNQYNKTANVLIVNNRGLIGSFRSLGSALGLTAGIIGLTQAARGLISTFTTFEATMSKVKAITGATGEDFNRLEETARQLGSTTQFSATEAAEAMTFLGMAGFNTNQILQAIPATLNLAAAGAIELGEAADISSNILSGFRLNAGEAGRVIDVMARTVTTSNTNIKQLGEAMKFIAPISATLGVSVEETAATIGALGNAGIQGQLATTSLSTALGRLADPPKKAAKAMKRLNIELFKNGKFKGLAGTIKELETAFVGLTDQQKLAATQQIFGAQATKQISALLGFQYTTMKDGEQVVLEGSEALKVYTESLEESQGAAKEMAEIMVDNLQGDALKAQSAMQELAISLGEKLAPTMRATVQGFTELIGWITENQSAIIRLGKVVATATGLYVGYRVVLASTKIVQTAVRAGTLLLSAAKSRLTGSTAKATASMKLFNNTMKVSPIGIFVTAMTTLAAIFLTSEANAQDLNKELTGTAKVSQDVAKFTNAVNENMTTEAANMKVLFDRLKETNPKSQERKDLIDKINSTYGTTLKNLGDEEKFVKQLDVQYNKLLSTLKQRIILQVQEEQIAALVKEQLAIEGVVNAYEDATKSIEAYGSEVVKTTDSGVELTQQQIDQVLTVDKLNESYGEQVAAQKGLEAATTATASANQQNLDRLKEIEATIKGIITEGNRQLSGLDIPDPVTGGGGTGAGGKKTADSQNKLREERLRLIEELNAKIIKLGFDLRDAEIENLEDSIGKQLELVEQGNIKRVQSLEAARQSEITKIDAAKEKEVLSFEEAEQSKKAIADLYGKLIVEANVKTSQKNTAIIEKATALQLVIFKQSLEERGDLTEQEQELLLLIQEQITQKLQEESQTQLQIKFNQLDKQAEREKQIASALITDAQELADRKKAIDLETAQAKFDLLKAELSLTEEITEIQIEQLQILYAEIKRLTASPDDDGEELTGLAKFLNISNDEAATLKQRAADVGRQIYDEFVSMRQQALKQQLNRELKDAQTQRNKEIKILQDSQKRGLISEQQFTDGKAAIEKNYQDKKTALEKTAFEQQKKFQRRQALINGATAILRIAADVPKADFGVVTALLIAAQGVLTGLQIAKIDAQTFGDGGQVTGGMTKGKSHPNGGEYGVTPDGSILNFEGGEFFVNRRAIASNDQMTVSGTPLQIAEQINAVGNNNQNRRGQSIRFFGAGGVVPSAAPIQTTRNPQGSVNNSLEEFADTIVEGFNDKQVTVQETEITDTQKEVEIIDSMSSF